MDRRNLRQNKMGLERHGRTLSVNGKPLPLHPRQNQRPARYLVHSGEGGKKEEGEGGRWGGAGDGEERETENREARKGRMKRSPGGGARKRNTHWEPLVTSQVLSYVQWQVPFPYGTIASSMIRTHEDEVRRAWT